MKELWARDSGCLLKVVAFIVSRWSDLLSFVQPTSVAVSRVGRSGRVGRHKMFFFFSEKNDFLVLKSKKNQTKM